MKDQADSFRTVMSIFIGELSQRQSCRQPTILPPTAFQSISYPPYLSVCWHLQRRPRLLPRSPPPARRATAVLVAPGRGGGHEGAVGLPVQLLDHLLGQLGALAHAGGPGGGLSCGTGVVGLDAPLGLGLLVVLRESAELVHSVVEIEKFSEKYSSSRVRFPSPD